MNPKKRSERWVTAVYHQGDNSEAAAYAGADYQLASYAKRVLLKEVGLAASHTHACTNRGVRGEELDNF